MTTHKYTSNQKALISWIAAMNCMTYEDIEGRCDTYSYDYINSYLMNCVNTIIKRGDN